MKKMLAFVMILALAMSAVACAEITDFTGRWYADMLGTTMIMTVNADGTLTMESAGTVQDATWVVEDGEFIINKGTDIETRLTVGENTLIMQTMTGEFSRETIGVGALPTFVAAPDISAFNGRWKLNVLCANGMVLNAEEAKTQMGQSLSGESTTMVIENGMVRAPGFPEQDIAFDFVDGYLTTTVPVNGAEMLATVEMCDNGGVAMSVNMAGIPIVMYFIAEN